MVPPRPAQQCPSQWRTEPIGSLDSTFLLPLLQEVREHSTTVEKELEVE